MSYQVSTFTGVCPVARSPLDETLCVLLVRPSHTHALSAFVLDVVQAGAHDPRAFGDAPALVRYLALIPHGGLSGRESETDLSTQYHLGTVDLIARSDSMADLALGILSTFGQDRPEIDPQSTPHLYEAESVSDFGRLRDEARRFHDEIAATIAPSAALNPSVPAWGPGRGLPSKVVAQPKSTQEGGEQQQQPKQQQQPASSGSSGSTTSSSPSSASSASTAPPSPSRKLMGVWGSKSAAEVVAGTPPASPSSKPTGNASGAKPPPSSSSTSPPASTSAPVPAASPAPASTSPPASAGRPRAKGRPLPWSLPLGPSLFVHNHPWVRASRVTSQITALSSYVLAPLNQMPTSTFPMSSVGVNSARWRHGVTLPGAADNAALHLPPLDPCNASASEVRWFTEREIEIAAGQPVGGASQISRHPTLGEISPDALALLPWISGSPAAAQLPAFSVLEATTPQPPFPSPPQGPVFSIDVECVATGTGHNDRAPGEIAAVDAKGNAVFHRYVETPGMVSYLTELTGLSEDKMAAARKEGKVSTLDAAIEDLKRVLPSDAVLVGSSIESDIRWLRLEPGRDFAHAVDLTKLFECFSPPTGRPGSQPRPIRFSLRALAMRLLGHRNFQIDEHDPMIDARVSTRLYTEFGCHKAAWNSAMAKLRVLAPVATRIPAVIDNVCMRKFNKRECICGQE